MLIKSFSEESPANEKSLTVRLERMVKTPEKSCPPSREDVEAVEEAMEEESESASEKNTARESRSPSRSTSESRWEIYIFSFFFLSFFP